LCGLVDNVILINSIFR